MSNLPKRPRSTRRARIGTERYLRHIQGGHLRGLQAGADVPLVKDEILSESGM
jgi:hypothetical protein